MDSSKRWTIIIIGGAIFVGWLVISEFTVMNLFTAFLLGGLAALVGVLFLLEARRKLPNVQCRESAG